MFAEPGVERDGTGALTVRVEHEASAMVAAAMQRGWRVIRPTPLRTASSQWLGRDR
jgi:hypothetical protein